MRLVVFSLCLSALGAGSFWALTSGPLSPHASVETVELPPAPGGRAAVDPPPPPPDYDGPTPVRTRVTNQVYAVTGATARDVLASLVDLGPRDGEDIFFGLTDTALDVTYNPTAMAGGCLIRDTRIALDATITLPEWVPPAGAAPETVRAWGRFRRALEAHEQRHLQIAADGADRAYRAVAELYRPTCPEAIEEARRRLERLGVEIKAAHRRFDDATDHGKTEGAVWPQ